MKQRRQRSTPPTPSTEGKRGDVESVRLPPLHPIDHFFLVVLIEFYQHPGKYFPVGRPSKGESWIGPVFLAFQGVSTTIWRESPPGQLECWIRELWPQFLNWNHLVLGSGFRPEMLANPRVAAVHAHADMLKRNGALPHDPPTDLAARVRHEAKRKGGLVDRNLTDDDALGQLYVLDDPTALTIGASGHWVLNIQLLYDRLRLQRRQESTGGDVPEVPDQGADPAEQVSSAQLARAIRDGLDDFSQEGPAEAAALERYLAGGSRKDVAAKHGVSVEQVRVADRRLDRCLSRLRQRLDS